MRPVGPEETLGLSRPFWGAGHGPCLVQTWSLLSLPFPLSLCPLQAAGATEDRQAPSAEHGPVRETRVGEHSSSSLLPDSLRVWPERGGEESGGRVWK